LINEGLALTKANGRYNELYDQWFGVYEHEEDRVSDLLGYLLPLTGMFLAITGYLYYRRQLLFTDITQMKEHQEQLEQFAHYDALTALPNRVLLADRLQQAMIRNIRNNTSLAVVFLDLDGFKQVNDKHGHNLGDQLLVALTHRMKDALREGDTLARFGGDEFVAVLADLEQPQDCKPVLSRLLEAMSAPVTIDDMMLQVSASLGVTVYPQDNADAEQLMRHADQAMYQAKQTGKNCYHLFDVDHDAAVKTRHESLEHIRHALERGEFVLYYQPKVNMKTGKVIGAEALVRWQHPERGLLAPALFLPIIENHPIIVELGEWVIDSALAQIAEWDVAGLDIEVSVNIGARQLLYGNFESRLAELLAGHPGVRPNNLVLEILETSALQDITQVSKFMHACRDMGICFALDDFGTGYSSLTYLKHLPADIVKIDQSFVRDMIDYPDDRTIVQGVIELAKAFRRSVIAEGVETIMHGEILLSLGCDQAQGYAIAHPMSAAEIPEWIANWRPDAAWMVNAT
jgi:diguanylate cyclase (GGDEF)-like protein